MRSLSSTVTGPGADATASTASAASTSSTPAPIRPATTVRERIGAYVALTKPRIIELLLITTVPTMFLAQGGFPPWWLVLATLFGGALAAGSANVLNCYLDRDIDQVMARTKRRPLVTGLVSPRAALVFGAVLGVVSLVWFALVVNVFSAWLAGAAIVIYVVGYTMILKRRTPQNIVWGGIAGCIPVLIGWSAVTGSLSWAPVLLFGVVFFWTPPHYWPLSMKFKGDYAAAGVPMLPVVATDTRVAVEMILHTAAMITCSLLLVPVAGMTWVYALVAATLGGWFLAACVRLLQRARAGVPPARLGAMRVFHHSITYLALLSLAVTVDPFIPL